MQFPLWRWHKVPVKYWYACDVTMWPLCSIASYKSLMNPTDSHHCIINSNPPKQGFSLTIPGKERMTKLPLRMPFMHPYNGRNYTELSVLLWSQMPGRYQVKLSMTESGRWMDGRIGQQRGHTDVEIDMDYSHYRKWMLDSPLRWSVTYYLCIILIGPLL